ncbi:MAG: nicotinate-nucleotide adenylyltransferase [Gemmatimonadales bacterium]
MPTVAPRLLRRRRAVSPLIPHPPPSVEALFGGSFDPVHLGHLVVAETVAEALDARVRFMPAREQPLKQVVGGGGGGGGGHIALPAQRVAMLELATAGNPRFAVEAIELTLPAPSYTVNTLRALAAREPGNRFTLLLGADAARDLPDWYEVEALPDLADVVVFARPGFAVPTSRLIARVVEVPALDVSATAIRARVAAGRSIRYLVPEPVREYIARHGLYR